MSVIARVSQCTKFIRGSRIFRNPRANCNSKPLFEALNTHYAMPVKLMHWAMGSGVLGCIGFVQISYYRPKSEKGYWMRLHKSCGLIVAGLLLPRIILRLASKTPPHLPGPKLLQLGANLSHLSLYGMMIYMPVSGILMGYYGGKGLPFFWTTIPGATDENKNPTIAKYSYKTHKLVGLGLEYFLPLHVGAVGFHMLRGENIFRRINPFAKSLITSA